MGPESFKCISGNSTTIDCQGIARLARWMKPGSIIVSYYNLEGPEFKQIGVVPQPTSWSPEFPWIVQEVQHNPSPITARPACLKRHDEFDVGSRRSFSAPLSIDKDISDICFESFKRWQQRIEKRGSE
jgi:hypothetical protein